MRKITCDNIGLLEDLALGEMDLDFVKRQNKM